MPRRHLDKSTRLNLERNLRRSGRHEERLGGQQEGRPLMDLPLEREADYATMVHLRGPHVGKGPKNYRRSDENIKEDVCWELYKSPEVDASMIDVEVKDHIVFLSGLIQDRTMKKKAEEVVENISGVEDVQNELTLIM